MDKDKDISWEEWGRIFTDITVWEPAIREICRREGISVTTVYPGFPGTNAVFLLDDKMVIKISPPQCHDDHRNELEIGRVLGNRVPIPKVLCAGGIPRSHRLAVVRDGI